MGNAYTHTLLTAIICFYFVYSPVDYGKEFYAQGGIEELVGLIKEYSFTGVVCENTAGALKNLKSFEPAKERIKTLFVEDNELSALLSGMNE